LHDVCHGFQIARPEMLKEIFPLGNSQTAHGRFRADLSDESAAAGVGEADSRKRLSCGGLFGGWRFESAFEGWTCSY